MPTASDLVTDLPADFEVFGQAVDTRLKALNPATTLGDITYASATANTNTRLPIGTNGQVLGVSGGVPAWVTDASGMTNPMTTTGDTIYSSSGSTPARLGIGSTGQVLTVSGGVPAWSTPSAGAYTSLATGSLSGSSISITSISGAYRDLVLVVSNFYNSTSSTYFTYTVNSTNNIYMTGAGNSGSATTSADSSTFYSGADIYNAAQTSTEILTLQNYASSTWKTGEFNTFTQKNATPDYTIINRMVGMRLASAITSIQIIATGGGTFTAGTYTLYGVK